MNTVRNEDVPVKVARVRMVSIKSKVGHCNLWGWQREMTEAASRIYSVNLESAQCSTSEVILIISEALESLFPENRNMLPLQ